TLERIAIKQQRSIPIQVCIDTGFGREGVPVEQAPSLIRDLSRQKSLRITGAMMTFTEDQQLDAEELSRFFAVLNSLKKDGIQLGHRHAASSFSLFKNPDSFLDLVRPGMAIYGIYSENEFRGSGVMDLHPAVGLRARVIYVKQLRKGDSAGYSPAYKAERDVWVALLPVGHADGWPRATNRKARVRIN